MKTYRAGSLNELHDILNCHRPHDQCGWCYRGQANIAWPLLPAAGRPQYHTGRDLGRLNAWREQAAYDPNPLVAAYFAAESLLDLDGALYCYLPQLYVDIQVAKLESIDHVAAYKPRALAPRLVRQAGLFTYHPAPNAPLTPAHLSTPFEGPDLIAIRIPSETKLPLLETLDIYGINQVNLFPELDGLSRHTNWQTRIQVEKRDKRGT